MSEITPTTIDWLSLINENFDKLKESLINIIQELLDSYDSIGVSAKGNLKHISISFLRTSINDRRPLYRIDFYDNKHFLDFEEHFKYWDIPYLANHLYIKHDEEITELLLWKKYKEIIELEKSINISANTLHECLGEQFTVIMEGVSENLTAHNHKFVKVEFGDYLNDYKDILVLKGENYGD